MGYSFSDEAIEDLSTIFQTGLRNFGAKAAERYYWTIIEAAELAAQYPLSVPIRPELTMEVRVRPVGSHLLVYQFDDPDVVVVRVLHHLQDWPQHL